MPKGKEITFYEKERIETYLRMKKKKIWIAKKLNRDYFVTKREVKRNSGKSILSVQSERKSRLCRIHKCEDKTVLASEKALRKSIDFLPSLWLTITRDNGSENVLHYETKIPSYFCDSYSSRQKGSVENLNGLIREYFPKKSNLDTISKKEIYLVQEKLNNRPRKCLNYLTPNEVIATELKKGL